VNSRDRRPSVFRRNTTKIREEPVSIRAKLRALERAAGACADTGWTEHHAAALEALTGLVCSIPGGDIALSLLRPDRPYNGIGDVLERLAEMKVNGPRIGLGANRAVSVAVPPTLPPWCSSRSGPAERGLRLEA